MLRRKDQAMLQEFGPRKVVEEGFGGVVKVEASEHEMNGAY